MTENIRSVSHASRLCSEYGNHDNCSKREKEWRSHQNVRGPAPFSAGPLTWETSYCSCSTSSGYFTWSSCSSFFSRLTWETNRGDEALLAFHPSSPAPVHLIEEFVTTFPVTQEFEPLSIHLPGIFIVSRLVLAVNLFSEYSDNCESFHFLIGMRKVRTVGESLMMGF